MTKQKQAWITTATLAAELDYDPASIRTSLWRHGHFHGLKPVRLPSGRLRWPADAVQRLTGQHAGADSAP